MINKIDFTELQEEVMQYWENNSIEFIEYEIIAFQTIHGSIKEQYQDILDNLITCVYELGFKSISSYIASKG